jgi:hypothetical protein
MFIAFGFLFDDLSAGGQCYKSSIHRSSGAKEVQEPRVATPFLSVQPQVGEQEISDSYICICSVGAACL